MNSLRRCKTAIDNDNLHVSEVNIVTVYSYQHVNSRRFRHSHSHQSSKTKQNKTQQKLSPVFYCTLIRATDDRRCTKRLTKLVNPFTSRPVFRIRISRSHSHSTPVLVLAHHPNIL